MLVKVPREVPQKVNKHVDKNWLISVKFPDPSLNRSKAIERTRLRHTLLMVKVPREITQKV